MHGITHKILHHYVKTVKHIRNYFLVQSSLDIHGGLVSGPLADTEILRCSNSFYKMA